ncbi:hypothetical protein PYCC9005_005238 [Savitreella phatthalungensis]
MSSPVQSPDDRRKNVQWDMSLSPRQTAVSEVELGGGEVRRPSKSLLKGSGSGEVTRLADRRTVDIPSIELPPAQVSLPSQPSPGDTAAEAYRLVRAHTILPERKNSAGSARGSFSDDKAGVLSQLMQLYNSTIYQAGSRSHPSTPKWHNRNNSTTSFFTSGYNTPTEEKGRDREIRIALNIAEVISRQRFILKLCRALMLYGAPTHRLEEYLSTTSKALDVDAQFLYLPGCMIVAFDDKATHTSDVKIVRVSQGCDIAKLEAIHHTYKSVLHACIDIQEGIREIDAQLEAPQLYRTGVVAFTYGVAAVAVGPFAFGSSWIDLPVQFLLGLIVGVLQLVSTRSPLYANVFEILATVIVSFVSRGFGSIRSGGGEVFCFGALAQSPIALILPGYMVLCGALELQNRSIVAGSVRLAYALVYSLFLSFAVTIGSLLYGLLDSSATTTTTCSSNINPLLRILWVPLFALALLIVNQAHPRQWAAALLIAGAGYAVNYFSSLRFGAAQVSNALGAFVIGCLGNLWSRIFHRLAFVAVLPAIWVQVPSGIASGSSLISGLELAASVANGTGNQTYSSQNLQLYAGNSLSFGYAMIQIAIGITVGLSASAIIIYVPVCNGRKRTGMLTF